MILGIEDIAGGTTILSILIWLGLTGLFYLVCYLAVLNVLDDITKNSILKIPFLLVAAPVAGFFMAIFNYNPLVWAILAGVSNFYRVRALPNNPKFKGMHLNLSQFFLTSYLYIVAAYALAAWFQIPVEYHGMIKPMWKTWFPDDIH